MAGNSHQRKITKMDTGKQVTVTFPIAKVSEIHDQVLQV